MPQRREPDSLGPLMDAQVPAVVAVVVTTGPGPWLDEALSSLAAQDYEELSVLVLSTGEDDPEVTERVGRVLPDAFVRHLPGRPGYAAAANEALGMVEGAAFFLLCHDDVALDPDAVHKLVEESFRSNAGVVSPKFVNWDDPRVLLHVGMSCDKTGAVVDRITEGEVDHGQHDAVRDVFVAPGGCILVRADLFAELKGFDAGIVAMGEDLDLSWRSQVAGSRVVVAPDARVRHREAVAGGLEPLAVAGEPEGRHPVTLQSLQRRHELRAVLKCYTRLHLLRVLPQAALLAFGEVVVAVLARDRDRARAVTGAWRWNVRRLTEISVLRGELAEHRLFPDAEVRRLQVRGSARLSRYLSRLSHQGLEAANAVAARERPEREDERRGRGGRPHRQRRLGLQRGRRLRRARRPGPAAGPGPLRAPGPSAPAEHRAPARRWRWSSPLLVIALGHPRPLLRVAAARRAAGAAPVVVDELAPLLLRAGSRPGWAPPRPPHPPSGSSGLSGTVLFGAMGTLQQVLLLGCIPLGAWGVSRFMRPLVSPRARVVAVICYLGLPLPYGALGTGRWDGLVAYAAFPFIALRLARAAGVAPYAVEPGPHWRSQPGRARSPSSARSSPSPSGFAPAVVPMVLATAVAWVLGSVLVGAREPTWRVLVVAVEAVVVALVLALPWVVGHRCWPARVRWPSSACPSRAPRAPSWGEVIRFAVGPAARSPIAWLLVAGAALPLVIARGTRLAWAARLWVTGAGLVGPRLRRVARRPGLLHAVRDRGAGPGGARRRRLRRPRHLRLRERPERPRVRLAPAGQRGGARSSWRSASSRCWAARSAGAGTSRRRASSSRWPSSPGPAPGVHRVLWLGDPRALPAGGWSVEPGLAYALTPEELPDSAQVFTPAGPGPADEVANAVRLAVSGGTVHLGRLLAPAGVRYVVVVDALAPSHGGDDPASVSAPPPAGLNTDLLEQDDLQVVPGVLGVQVYENGADMPVTATPRRAPCPSARRPTRRRRRGGLAAGAQRALGRRCRHRRGAGRHPLRGLRAGRELRPHAGRAHGGAAAGVRLGGAVRRRRQGPGHALALPVPPRPPGGAPGAGRLGGPGRSPSSAARAGHATAAAPAVARWPPRRWRISETVAS